MKLSRLLLRVVLVETAEAVLCGPRPTDTHPDSALSPPRAHVTPKSAVSVRAEFVTSAWLKQATPLWTVSELPAVAPGFGGSPRHHFSSGAENGDHCQFCQRGELSSLSW